MRGVLHFVLYESEVQRSETVPEAVVGIVVDKCTNV